MKRNTLTTAVLAGLTGMAGMVSVSNAVNVNPDGLGQVLLYPYYTARGGNDTLISIVNTTERGKAVKVRFIEGLNSREVLDFNLYMSPFDVWTAAVTADEGGGAKMVTTDTTCTVPYFVGAGEGVGEQEFLDFEYTGFTTNFDAGPQGIERTASGYIEIIEMGTMQPHSASYDPNEDGLQPQIVEWASKHVGGVPRACSILERMWTQGDPVGNATWLNNANFGLDTEQGASGGLFGSGSIINVAEGTMFSYNATAIDGFWAQGDGEHTNPGSVLPGLNSGTNNESIVFNQGALEIDQWDAQTPVLALNAALTYDQLMNEYITSADINARTEWVMTLPTKRFHTDALGKGFATPGNPVPPFTRTWYYDVLDGEIDRRFFACEDMSIDFWDREEQQPAPGTDGPIVSPPPPDPAPDLFQLCREANVVRFSSNGDVPDATEILGEPLRDAPFSALSYTNFELPYDSGWAMFNLGTLPPNSTVAVDERRSVPSENGRQVLGLPVVGFGVTTYTNGATAGGVLANYGGTFQHRGTRVFESAAD